MTRRDQADTAGPLGAFAWLGGVLEPLYRAEVARRNRAWDRGKGVTRLRVPVISVGNISVGGTGKTPMVKLIVEHLLQSGLRPVVAMRGYKRSESLAQAAEPGPREAQSDEQAEYLARWGERVPIVAQPDRLTGLRPVLEENRADVVVLDDGFQHRRIARDLDIVLIDATRDPARDHCLPAGWLREPLSSVRRAHAVVITRADQATPDRLSAIQRFVTGAAPHAAIAFAQHEPDRLIIDGIEHPPRWLSGRPVVAVSAIGNPGAFVRTLRDAGAIVQGELTMPDHHDWCADDLEALAGLAARFPEPIRLVTTEKDWVKLSRLKGVNWPGSLAVLRVRMTLGRGGEGLLTMIDRAARGNTPARLP